MACRLLARWAVACLLLAVVVVNISFSVRLGLCENAALVNVDQHPGFVNPKQQHRDIHAFLSKLSTSGNNDNSNNAVRCNITELHPFQNQLRSQRSPSKMPHIIHFDSKTKCVTLHIKNYIMNWRLPFFSIYLHDDQEMNNLFELDKLFPSLKNATRCLPYQGLMSSASKNDLFRFLLYYHVGGIYTEFDLRPSPRGSFPDAVEQFEAHLMADATKNEPEVDGAAMIFLKRNRMPFLGTMLATPKHPFFYICVDLVIRNLLALPNVANQRAFGVTGPPILHKALQIFSGVEKKPDEGWDIGTYSMSDRAKKVYPYLATHKGNFTITIPEHDTFYDYVFEPDRDMLNQKHRYYKLAGLRHWQREDKGVHEYDGSCSEYLKKKA